MTACQFETSVTFAVSSSAIEFKMKIWKSITGTIMLSINNPMQFSHLEITHTPCLASVTVDPSVS